jgi:hypothetical protein
MGEKEASTGSAVMNRDGDRRGETQLGAAVVGV